MAELIQADSVWFRLIQKQELIQSWFRLIQSWFSLGLKIMYRGISLKWYYHFSEFQKFEIRKCIILSECIILVELLHEKFKPSVSFWAKLTNILWPHRFAQRFHAKQHLTNKNSKSLSTWFLLEQGVFGDQDERVWCSVCSSKLINSKSSNEIK